MGKKIIATPPGRTIAEQLEVHGMTKYEFGVRTGWSHDYIGRLIDGMEDITLHVAYKLEEVLGPPAQFWLKLDERYRARLMERISQLNKEVIESALKNGYMFKF